MSMRINSLLCDNNSYYIFDHNVTKGDLFHSASPYNFHPAEGTGTSTLKPNDGWEIRFQQLDHLEKLLIKADYNQAETVYQNLHVDDKLAISIRLEDRNRIWPFTSKFELGNLDQMFPFKETGIPYDFYFNRYLLPSIQSYILEVFEPEREEFILKQAQSCKDYLSKKNFLSPNHPIRHEVLSEHIAKLKVITGESSDSEAFSKFHTQISERLEEMRDQSKPFFEKEPKKTPVIYYSMLAHIYKTLRLGNCQEIAQTGFYYLLKKQSGRIEIFGFSNGDHKFVIFGRENGSDPSNYLTWGRECLVIDLWTEKQNIFFAHEMPIHLENYLGKVDQYFKPMTEPFDPQRHKLQLQNYAIYPYSTRDLEEYAHPGADEEIISWMLVQLKQFEDMQSDEDKAAVAQDILNASLKCTNELNQLLVKNLKIQMHIFLDPDYLHVYNLDFKFSKDDLNYESLKKPINLDKSFISRILIQHLVKISNFFFNHQTRKAQEKLEKLHPSIFEPIKEHFLVLSAYENTKENTHIVMAEAIQRYLFDRVILASRSGKEKTAQQIFKLLPDWAQQQINNSLRSRLLRLPY